MQASNTSPIKKYVYIFLGSLALTLGILGIVLPILPTTPFLLLASFFYVRSSTALYNRLMNHRVLGPYITEYIKHRAIKKQIKISAIMTLWVTLLFSMWIVSSLMVTFLLLAVGVGVTAHLLSLKTL